MDDEDRCEAEIERIVRDPDRHRYDSGSRRQHKREYRRCPWKHTTYNRAMYPTGSDSGMHAVEGMVCRRHTGYLQRKWSGDHDG